MVIQYKDVAVVVLHLTQKVSQQFLKTSHVKLAKNCKVYNRERRSGLGLGFFIIRMQGLCSVETSMHKKKVEKRVKAGTRNWEKYTLEV